MVQLLAMASRPPVSNLPSYSSPVHLTVSTTSTHPQPDRSRGHQPAGDRARARVVRACAPSKFPARPPADVARHPQLDRAEVNAPPAFSNPHPTQGLKFRRNFTEIRRKISFSLVTGKKNFGIFRKISFENSKFKKFRPKFTEISERNFVSAKHRDLQRKRNG